MPVVQVPRPNRERGGWSDVVNRHWVGVLSREEVWAVLDEAGTFYSVVCPPEFELQLFESCRPLEDEGVFSDLRVMQGLDPLALVAVRIFDRAERALLTIELLQEIRFAFSTEARIALRLGWEAMAKYGRFLLPPQGATGSSSRRPVRRTGSSFLTWVPPSTSPIGRSRETGTRYAKP